MARKCYKRTQHYSSWKKIGDIIVSNRKNFRTRNVDRYMDFRSCQHEDGKEETSFFSKASRA